VSRAAAVPSRLMLVVEAGWILDSPEFARLRAAAGRNDYTEIRLRGRRIAFEPSLPPNRCAMTLSDEGGFLLGPGAFSSEGELRRTVLQEIFRLELRDGGGWVDRRVARRHALAARRFADWAYETACYLALV
jgi:hypothetical protein